MWSKTLKSVFLSSLIAVTSFPSDFDSLRWDIGFRSGSVSGSLSQVASGITTTTNYTGIPLALGTSFEFMRWLTVGVYVQGVLDLSSQVSRTGVDGTFAFHLVGGARRIFSDYGDILVLQRDPYAFSVLARAGFYAYNLPTSSIEGTVLDISAGLGYRYDFSSRFSVTAAGLYSLTNIAASTNRISVKFTTVELEFRIFL